MPTIFVYLLLAHGPKHTAPVQHLPGAQRQLSLLKEVARKNDADIRIVGHDYARRVRSCEDLPELFHRLKLCKERSPRGERPISFLMDDYSRLFRAAEENFRLELWAELMEYSDHLRDLHHREPLHALSPELSLVKKSGAWKPWTRGIAREDRPFEERQAQTRKASETSKLA